MRLLIVAILLTTSSILFAGEISNQSRLRKAAYLLTGTSPTPEEADTVASMNDDDFNQYFRTKLDEYLARDSFATTFRPNLLRLFRMYVPYVNSSDFENNFRNENAFDNLILELLEKNQPWRDLLLSQDYEATDIVTPSSGGDLFFFQFVFYEELGPQLQNFVETQEAQGFFSSSSEVVEIPLQATTTNQQQTLAGVVTTQRFFGRFPTTKINKNRGRAAALFRTFLCDPMKPIVLTDAEEDRTLLEKSLQMDQAHRGTTSSQDLEARHGSDPQCMACHYKLDPMASVFAGSSLNLNPFAAPGALVYKTKRGEKVDIEVTGFKELAEAIVTQPDYLSCQVQHFWDWVIGEDIPLEDSVKSDLVDAFVSVDEKPKDFIKILMNSDYFYRYSTLGEEDIRYAHVRPIFERCDSCHSGESMAPDLSGGYPFNSFYEQYYGRPLVEQIAIETKLSHQGNGSTMPPRSAGWDLRPEERDLLLAWIKNGARDNDGQPHYQSGEMFAELSRIEYEEGFKEFLEPTFYTTFTRLLTGNVLLQSLSDKFDEDDNYSTCSFSDNDRNTVGFPVAVDGRPIFKYVNPNYLRWWYSCLQTKESVMRQYYSSSEFLSSPQTMWSASSDEEKREILKIAEQHILGVGVIPSDNLENIFNQVNEKLAKDPYQTNLDALVLFAKTLLSTRYFLTY